MKTPFLHMIMIGCTPKGRFTEQHDIFFGVGTSLKELIPDMISFWPEAEGKIHIDAWQKITQCDGYTIEVIPKEQLILQDEQLFFLNLGGYKENEFEEFHYKVLTVAKNKAEAIKKLSLQFFINTAALKVQHRILMINMVLMLMTYIILKTF